MSENDNSEKLDKYIEDKVIEKHKTCLKDKFDNGYFWAMKDLQEFIRNLKDDNQ